MKKHGEAVVDLECEEEVNPDRGDVAFAGQGLDYRDSVKLYANFPAANNGTPTSVLSKSRQSLQLSGTLSDASQRNQVSKIWHPCQCYAHADRISSGYAVTPSPSLVRTRKESPSEASYQTGAASEDTLDDDSIEAHKRKLPVKLRLRTGEDRGNVQANANPPSKQASVLCINCKCKCVDMQSD